MSDTQSIAALSEILDLTNKIARKREESKFDLFKPYPKQLEFLNSQSSVKCLLGGNRCLGGETEIFDPVLGDYRRVDEIDGDFYVMAWDGEGVVKGKAHEPFEKDEADIYEVEFADGTIFTVSMSHLIWVYDKWMDVASVVNDPKVVRSSKWLRRGIVWDFEVEEYHNYFIGSILNHNSGKTHTAAYEIVCHITGKYPKWWQGHRITHHTPWVWVAGVSGQQVRDTMQEKLLGPIGKWGTGMIPKDMLIMDDIVKKPGVPFAVDIIPVKHISGGIGYVQLFSYDQERERFQGRAIDFGFLDEEPPEGVNSEIKARVMDREGHIAYTFTPLSGVTPLYDSILKNDSIHKIWISWDDVTHLSEKAKETMLEGMSESEIQARKYGIAVTGTGKVFNFGEEDYVCDDFEIPKHYPQLGGLDIGLTHPTAAVKIRYDEESDIIYVTNEYRVVGKTPLEHAHHLTPWKCRFSLSKDAWNMNNQTRNTTAKVYQDAGLDVFMCDMAKGSVDASIHEIRARVASGRFFIFKSCQMCVDEFRTYRSNDKGVIVKVGDDLIAAIRYAIMKLDKAEVPGRQRQQMDFIIPQYKPATRYEGC